jgi:hypothetical protein
VCSYFSMLFSAGSGFDGGDMDMGDGDCVFEEEDDVVCDCFNLLSGGW